MKLETFFDKFELFADAPNAVQKMRELIFSLAVRGKLVPQDPNDEPASVLIERISRARRAAGLKDYGMENVDDAPYGIPDSWSWVKLGNVSLSSDSGWSPQCSSESRVGDKWGVLKVSAVSWGIYKPEENKALPAGMVARPECEVKAGDFLLSRANTEELVARSVVIDRTPPHLMMSDKIVRFRFPEELNKSFINLANLSGPSREYYARNASGTSSSMKNVGREVMCNLPIALPPAAEQKRIVAKVDELMALCDRLEAQQNERQTRHTALARAAVSRFADAPTPANLDFIFHNAYAITPADLRKTILTLAVQGKLVQQDPNDEPADVLIERISKKRRAAGLKSYGAVDTDETSYEIPYSWSWVRLGNVSLLSDSGWSPQCESESRSGTEWGVLKVSAVSWGAFKPEENKALPTGMTARPDCEVKPGDFLLSRANTEELVARSVVVDKTPPHLMMSDKIVRFRFPDEIDKSFINLANLSGPSREYYARNASGTSSSMKNIGREVMCNLPIALPPLAEQCRIVAKVDELMKLVEQLEQQIEASEFAAEKLMTAIVAELTATRGQEVA